MKTILAALLALPLISGAHLIAAEADHLGKPVMQAGAEADHNGRPVMQAAAAQLRQRGVRSEPVLV